MLFRYSGANRQMKVTKEICSDAEREILRTWMKHKAGRMLNIRQKDDATIWMILKRISKED